MTNGKYLADGSFGGARGSRTLDLLLAKQALSQLSYGPDRLFELELYLRRLPVGR